MTIGNNRTERWRTLRQRDAIVAFDGKHFHFDPARRSMLSQLFLRRDVTLSEDILGCNRGVTHKWRFMLRHEKTHSQIVVVALGGKHKRRFTIHFRRNGEHLLVTEIVRIQYHRRRIAAEALARKGIDVEQPAPAIGHETPAK